MQVAVWEGVRVWVHVDGTEVVQTVLVSPHPPPAPVQRLDPGECAGPGRPVRERGRGGHADHGAGRTWRTCGTRGTHGGVMMVAILPVTIIKDRCWNNSLLTITIDFATGHFWGALRSHLPGISSWLMRCSHQQTRWLVHKTNSRLSSRHTQTSV